MGVVVVACDGGGRCWGWQWWRVMVPGVVLMSVSMECIDVSVSMVAMVVVAAVVVVA